MAEKKDQGPFENPTNHQSEKLPEKKVPADGAATVHPHKEKEDMEVHHHPKLSHKPKPWKEYFLEFLMIFLAVTMGFFAESLREHFVNKEKERHYIQNLTADLRNDISQIDKMMAIQKLFHQHLDSALNIPIESLGEINKQDSFLYHFFPSYSLLPAFIQNDNTISQLKVGGFNIFSNQAIIDSINNTYYNRVKYSTDFWINTCWDCTHQAQKIMRLPSPATSINDPNLFRFRANYQVFIEYDKKEINELYNKIGNANGTLETVILNEQSYRDNVVHLLAYLKTKYKSD